MSKSNKNHFSSVNVIIIKQNGKKNNFDRRSSSYFDNNRWMIHVIRFMRNNILQWILMTYENDQIIDVPLVVVLFFTLFRPTEKSSLVCARPFVNYNSNKINSTIFTMLTSSGQRSNDEALPPTEHDNFRARPPTLILINVNLIEIDFMMNAARCEMRTKTKKIRFWWVFCICVSRIEMADKFDWNWQLAGHFKWHRNTNWMMTMT